MKDTYPPLITHMIQKCHIYSEALIFSVISTLFKLLKLNCSFMNIFQMTFLCLLFPESMRVLRKKYQGNSYRENRRRSLNPSLNESYFFLVFHLPSQVHFYSAKFALHFLTYDQLQQFTVQYMN